MNGSMSRRSIRLRVALIVSLSIVPVLVVPTAARACSCIRMDLQDSIRTRGAQAFVGEVTQASLSDGQIIYRFRVDDAVAGDLGSELVALTTSPVGTECGVGLEIGERAAFVLGLHGGRWLVSTCGRADPDEMLSAASFLGFLQSRSAYPWFAIVAVIAVLGAIRVRKRPRSASLA